MSLKVDLKRENEMSLQEDAKQILLFVQEIANGSKAARHLDEEELIGLKLIGMLRDDRTEPFKNLYIIEPPKFRPWASVKEMGEAVNHWFRLKGLKQQTYQKAIAMNDEQGVKMALMTPFSPWQELFRMVENSPTPWIADSWQPCGIVYDERKKTWN